MRDQPYGWCNFASFSSISTPQQKDVKYGGAWKREQENILKPKSYNTEAPVNNHSTTADLCKLSHREGKKELTAATSTRKPVNKRMLPEQMRGCLFNKEGLAEQKHHVTQRRNIIYQQKDSNVACYESFFLALGLPPLFLTVQET